jgi:hypothetical protein
LRITDTDPGSASSATFRAENGGATLGAYSNHPLYLVTNNTTKMTVLKNGNVGIGTTSPDGMLDIQTDGTDAVPLRVQSMHPNQTGLRLTNGAGDTASTWTLMSKSYGDTLSPSSLAFMHGTSVPSQENQTLVLRSGAVEVVGTLQSNVPNTDANAFSKLTYGGGNTKVDGTGDNRTTQPAMIMHRIGEDGSSERTVSIHSDKESYFLGGNVGIGTSLPTYAKLAIRGGAGYDDITRQPMKTQLEVYTSDEASGIQSIQRDNNNAASDIHFWGNDFIFRSVNGTGNVGIGTSTPISTLQVENENSTLYNGVMPTIQNVTGCFRNRYSNGIKRNTHTGLQFNVYGNKDESMDLTDMQNQNVLGYVGVVAEQDNTNKGALVFHSSPNGTNRLEGMRLASNNNFGIGTTYPKALVSIRGNNSGDKARITFLGDGNGVIGSVRGEVVENPQVSPVSDICTKGDLTFHTNSYSQVAGGTYSDDVEKEVFRLTTDGGMVHSASGFYRSRAAYFHNTTADNTKWDREIKFYVGANMNYRIKITIDGLAPFNYNGTAFFKEYEIIGQTETVNGNHWGNVINTREFQVEDQADKMPDFYEINFNKVASDSEGNNDCR